MRNSLHIIAGALIAFLLSFTFDNLWLYEQIIITIIVVGVIACWWEIIREMYGKSFFDLNDVIRTVIGGIVVILILAI